MPSDPFLGQIMMCAFNYAPKGWAFCNGQTLQISQYGPLYSLLGTMYGGDGITTFNLPNLSGRVPMHFDASHVQGSAGGSAAVGLTLSNVGHSHPVAASTQATASDPRGNVPAGGSGKKVFAASGDGTKLADDAVGTSGITQPHPNMQPSTCVNFVIALSGIFPSRN